MKHLLFTLFLTFSVLIPANAQNNSASEFYSYLNQTLEDKNNKTIQLLITNYGCLGSKIDSEVTLIKQGNNVLIRHVDTTFTIAQKKIIKNFNKEIIAIKPRMILLEAEYKIVVNSENYKKEFELKRAEGLEFLLRYNKPYETYFKERIDREKLQQR